MTEHQLPSKVLVVHRFTRKMPTNSPSCDRITYKLVGCRDDGLMTPQQVLESLYPVPLHIQYQ